ncbi:MAG: site-specific integrase, partial [Betaproteobacteria bacterium]
MGKRKQLSGLIKRSGIWHIDKQINGRRICKTTGTTDRREAEQILRQEIQYLSNRKPIPIESRTFGEAAVKWTEDNLHRKSIDRDVQDLRQVLPYLGESPLKQVHQLTLEPFMKKRKSEGVSSSTVKRAVSTVSRVLQYAHKVYRDEFGEPWLDVLPSFKVPEWSKARERYCLSLEEVTCLESALSPELRLIMHFLLNTGLRDAELRNLRWDMEEEPVDGCLVFLLPGTLVKNVTDRLVFCNAVASRIVNRQRALGSEWVFPVRGKMRKSRIGSSGWRDGRK